MKMELNLRQLRLEAIEFCKVNSGRYRSELFGVTDGKAIGTFIEHLFIQYLEQTYEITPGNSAFGLDLPSLDTDIKVTSARQPQSSCPYRDSRQKIFGLGYNLLLFVYKKYDDSATRQGMLDFVSCVFIDKARTADYQTTTGLQQIIANNGNQDDIFAFLIDHNIPGDETTLYNLAQDILKNPPETGYLTISNALQWRLQYSRVVSMHDNAVKGIEMLR